jgi:IclR family mhp operon transcriptional activator
LLDKVRRDGYAVRDPRTKPYRTTTLAVPIREGDCVHALVSISIFTTAVPREHVVGQIVAPLQETIRRIEQALAFTLGHAPVTNDLEHEAASF